MLTIMMTWEIPQAILSGALGPATGPLMRATANSRGKAPDSSSYVKEPLILVGSPMSSTQTHQESPAGIAETNTTWSNYALSPGEKRSSNHSLQEPITEDSVRRVKPRLIQSLLGHSRVGVHETIENSQYEGRTIATSYRPCANSGTGRYVAGLMIGIDLGTTNSAVAHKTVAACDRGTFKFGPDELLEANVKRNKVLSLVKMLLGGQPPNNIRSTSEIIRDLHVSGVKPNATVVSVTAAMLKWLYKHTVCQIINSHYPVVKTKDSYCSLNLPIEFVLCVPAVWGLEANDKTLTALKLACERTVEVDESNSARFAGRDFDRGRDHVFTLVREPTCVAATMYERQLRLGDGNASVGLLQIGDIGMVVDAGGGTVDFLTFIRRRSSQVLFDEIQAGDGMSTRSDA
ncbi:hypothetical protein MMC18_003671 [Xylographa bjoerkii]|nr:hypothetical protein [Xylographa bjoerkii]